MWRGAYFNPRPPRGGRPLNGTLKTLDEGLFQSTPSSRRATDSFVFLAVVVRISIHALLAEGDRKSQQNNKHLQISIHALLAEGDRWSWPRRR